MNSYWREWWNAKAVANGDRALEFVPNCYKTKKMCNEAVNTYNSFLNNIRINKCLI